MFLCRLSPSCPLSRSAVDPSWHFSAGTHEAAVSDKTRAFSYNIQTTWLFPLLCLYLWVHIIQLLKVTRCLQSLLTIFSSPTLFFCQCSSSKLYMRAAALQGLCWGLLLSNKENQQITQTNSYAVLETSAWTSCIWLQWCHEMYLNGD